MLGASTTQAKEARRSRNFTSPSGSCSRCHVVFSHSWFTASVTVWARICASPSYPLPPPLRLPLVSVDWQLACTDRTSNRQRQRDGGALRGKTKITANGKRGRKRKADQARRAAHKSLHLTEEQKARKRKADQARRAALSRGKEEKWETGQDQDDAATALACSRQEGPGWRSLRPTP